MEQLYWFCFVFLCLVFEMGFPSYSILGGFWVFFGHLGLFLFYDSNVVFIRMGRVFFWFYFSFLFTQLKNVVTVLS